MFVLQDMPYQFIKDQVGIQNTPPVDMAIFLLKDCGWNKRIWRKIQHVSNKSPVTCFKTKEYLDWLINSLFQYFRVEKTKTFSGSEEEPPREKSLKKIQIEIVRNIKAGHRSSSPVRRSLKSYDTLTLPRRQGKYLCEPFVSSRKYLIANVAIANICYL